MTQECNYMVGERNRRNDLKGSGECRQRGGWVVSKVSCAKSFSLEVREPGLCLETMAYACSELRRDP